MAVASNKPSNGRKRGPGWQKGQSGNPAGRKPDKDAKAIRQSIHQLMGGYGAKAAKVLYDIMMSKKSHEGNRVRCANIILEQLYGKPDIRIGGTTDGRGIKVDIETIRARVFKAVQAKIGAVVEGELGEGDDSPCD